MGKDIYDTFGTAKRFMDSTEKILNIQLTKYMFNWPIESLTKTSIAQPGQIMNNHINNISHPFTFASNYARVET